MHIGGNNWCLEIVQQRVEKFCEMLKKQGLTIKLFIEGGMTSDETINKFKDRCELDIHNG